MMDDMATSFFFSSCRRLGGLRLLLWFYTVICREKVVESLIELRRVILVKVVGKEIKEREHAK